MEHVLYMCLYVTHYMVLKVVPVQILCCQCQPTHQLENTNKYKEKKEKICLDHILGQQTKTDGAKLILLHNNYLMLVLLRKQS